MAFYSRAYILDSTSREGQTNRKKGLYSIWLP